MEQPNDPVDRRIDELVRDWLEAQAKGTDVTRLMTRVRATTAAGAGSVWRARWRVRVAWAAAAVVFLALGSAFLKSWPGTVHAAALIQKSLEVHLLPVDRCYLVTRQREGGQSPDSSPPRVDRLWTRGAQFYWESSNFKYNWAWGRDEQGAVWLTHGKRQGIKLQQDELPPWLATLCEILSLQMETLLDSVLHGHKLTVKDSDAPGAVLIHAAGQAGSPRPWLKEATLEIDRDTRAVRRATVTRRLRNGEVAVTSYTLVSIEAQPGDRYQLEGHLESPFEVFTRDHKPERRQAILSKLFGPKALTPRADRPIASPSKKPES
ncbi:MAG: hypothetical protein FJ279_27325 [Planctomycetes bacterium]|nr:hypothetical protein [Planctomycetota bacterium]